MSLFFSIVQNDIIPCVQELATKDTDIDVTYFGQEALDAIQQQS